MTKEQRKKITWIGKGPGKRKIMEPIKRIKKEWNLSKEGKEIKLVKTVGNKYYLSTFVLLSKLEAEKIMGENGLK